MSKLRFRVVHFSSEDPEYPAEELNVHCPSTKGWQSEKYCEYPQELGFEMTGRTVQLTQVQILSHQSKIAQKVEVFVGTGVDYHTAKFVRLGHMALDNNERTGYNARELKTVHVDATCQFVRFQIHRNYTNKLNIYGQVGIIAVNFAGSEVDNDDGDFSRQSSKKKSQLQNNNLLNDLSLDMNLDPETVRRLRSLAAAKNDAIEAEDYSMAKKIKVVEDELKSLGAQLTGLDLAKREAVRSEDYDRASDLKRQIDQLRAQIEKKILAINIPGFDRQLEAKPQRQQQHQRVQQAPEEDMAGYASPRSKPAAGNSRPPAGNRDQPPFDELPVGVGSKASAPPSQQVQFDEIVVGGGNGKYAIPGGSSEKAVPSNSGKKARSSEPPEAIDDDGEHYNDGDFEYEEEEAKPSKRSGRGVRDEEVSEKAGFRVDAEYEDDADAGEEEVDMTGHPLEGVHGAASLPEPEELTNHSKDIATQAPQGAVTLLAAAGEYRTRCLFSKVWGLREAVLAKLQLMLNQEELLAHPGLIAAIPALSTAVRIGIEDKFQQVVSNAYTLLDSTIHLAAQAGVSRKSMEPMEPVITALIEKMTDGNGRIREGAETALKLLASVNCVGPTVIASHALKTLTAKEKSHWKPLLARLQVLFDIVSNHGLSGQSGLTTDSVMGFMKTYGAFTHSNNQVRECAKKLTISVQHIVGTEPIESYLNDLRKLQKEEYLKAFVDNPSAQSPAVKKAPEKTNNHQMHTPGGKVNTSAAKSGDKYQSTPDGPPPQPRAESKVEGEPEDFTCPFCQEGDETWDENAQDLHYLKDCPMLAPCPACAQVLEIAALPDHLLDECEHKGEFVPCNVTGLAIRKNDYDAWCKSDSCTPAPENCFYCPLCLSSVEDSNDAWRDHLYHSCPQNSRTNNRR